MQARFPGEAARRTACWRTFETLPASSDAVCLVPLTKRVDVNNAVKRRPDVRKASFLPQDRAAGFSVLEFGGIAPPSMPWPILLGEPSAQLSRADVLAGRRMLIDG